MKISTVISLVLYLLITPIASIYAEEAEFIHPEYTAEAVVLMDANTGLVLYESNGDTQMYPASITKVMTALIVLEQNSDLNERIEFSNRAVFSIPRNSSHIAMDEGETLTILEALYGLMLASANEVSLALAEHTAGSIEEFVDLMNRRAASLGAVDTHFTNPSGLPGVGHVTTAYDMSLIMREAITNPTFVEIISTNRFDIPPTERQPEIRELLNTNRMIRPGQFYSEYVVGGKTGWTNDAGNTLVTYAENGERRLIVTILRGEGTGAFTDTISLLDFGFNIPLEITTIFDEETYNVSVPVNQEIAGTQVELGRTNLRPANSLEFELPSNFDPSWLRYDLSIPETLTPPVLMGDAVGSVSVYVQNIRVGNVPLISQDAIFPYTAPTETVTDALNYVPHYTPQSLYNYNARLNFLDNEYIITLAIPLAISLITLSISLIILLIKRKRRRKSGVLHRRYARYPDYRYR